MWEGGHETGLQPSFYLSESSSLSLSFSPLSSISSISLLSPLSSRSLFSSHATDPLLTRSSEPSLPSWQRAFDATKRIRYSETLFVVPQTRDPAQGPAAVARLLREGTPCPKGVVAYDFTHDR